MSARNMAKRTAAGTLALAVCLGGGALALAGAANADANFKFDTRIEGADRYGTAIAASKAAFPEDGKTANVILVNGYATVDGLTASYLAGVANAPILYVSDKGADDATKAEIKRLGAKNIWLVGGDKVIPTSVEAAIKADGYTVNRVSGEDRYETAAAIAEAGIKLNGGKKPSKVFIASGESFADALAVSPVAFVKGYPIILTGKDKTSDASKKELGIIGTDTKILVGGTAVVSDSVAKDLTVSTRVAGDDRAVTANLVSDWAKKNEGFNRANAALVGGTNGNGADSLVAASLGGKSFTTLHFAGWDATYTYLKDHASELSGKGFVFGGKAAVSNDQVDKAQAAAQAVQSNQAITVTPSDAKVLDVSTTDEANRGSRTYTAAGLEADTLYDIALIPAANVKVAKDGSVTFVDANSNNQADGLNANLNAQIEVANGASVNTKYLKDTKPVDGKIVFSVDSTNYDSVIPVVFVDSTKDDQFNLVKPTDANADPKAAAEKFGLAGASSWIPEESADLASTSVTVLYVDPDKKFFVGSYSSGPTLFGHFDFSGGDTFQYRTGYSGSAYTNSTITASQFATALSVGDVVTTAYSKSYQSTFTVTTDKLATPAGLDVKVADYDNDINNPADDAKFTIAGADPAQGLVNSYDVAIYKADKSDTDSTPAGAQVGSTVSTTTKSVTVNDLPNGDYVARVRAVAGTGDYASSTYTKTAGDWGKLIKFSVQVGDKDSVAPILVDTYLEETGSGANNVIDYTSGAADKIHLRASEGLADLVTGDKIRFTDPDGEIFQLTVGTNVTAAAAADYTNASNKVITKGEIVLTLTAAPVKVGGPAVASTNAGAQAPSTITSYSADSLEDLAGNDLDLEKSTDKVIDNEL